MKLLAAACLVVCLVLPAVAGRAQRDDTDYGRIVRSTPSSITVAGAKGRHVLVPTKACEWCRRGTRVVVTFERAGKANLAPDTEPPAYAPVPVLVLEQGYLQR